MISFKFCLRMPLKISLCFIALTVSSNVFAAPCDSCVQNAIEGATNAIKSSIEDLSASGSQLKSAFESMDSTIETLEDSRAKALEAQHKQQVESIKSASETISQKIVTLDKQMETNSKALQTFMDGQLNAMEDLKNKREQLFYKGPDSVPISNTLAKTRENSLLNGLFEKERVKQLHAKCFKEHINDKMSEACGHDKDGHGQSDRGGLGYFFDLLSSKDEETWNPTPLLTKRTLTEDEVKQSVFMIRHLFKLTPGTDRSDPEENIKNAKSEMLHSIMTSILADKMPLIEASDWKDIAWSGLADDGAPDKTVSEEALLFSEVYGRVGTKIWLDDIARMNEVGVLRERISMQAMRNLMLHKLIEQERNRTIIESIAATKK